MSLLAAHLNDAGIVVVKDDKIVYAEAGFALLEDDHLVTGQGAYDSASLKPRRIQNRYWSNLTVDSLSDGRFAHMSPADLASRQLEQIWQQVAAEGDQLAIAVPPFMNTENLGLLLGIASELNIEIVSLCDAAVAATRREYKEAVPVHIDLSLHCSTLTRLLQNGRCQVERTAIVDDAGLMRLQEIWVKQIAEAFVNQSRFDPLHTAETEQSLRNRLPGWLAQAAASGTIEVQIEFLGVSHSATIESLDLITAAAPVYQSIVSSLRALFRAEETPAIQLSDRAGRMPGLADTLRSRVGGAVFMLEPGATSRGLLKRCTPAENGSAVTLARHLPWDQTAVAVQVDEHVSGIGQPTHLLFGHNAMHLNGKPLVLGSQAADGERHVDFQEAMAGLSRRHAVVSSDNGQFVITDHSRYGTFLNGHRIDGSAVLQTGDLIRIGTPGFELRLIHAEDVDGT